MSVVPDASAALAFLLAEQGADVVAAAADGSFISAVNFSEVLEKTSKIGVSQDVTAARLIELGVAVIPFDTEQARLAAKLKPLVERKNISLADRACLALGQVVGRTILTGDRRRTELDLGFDLRLIR